MVFSFERFFSEISLVLFDLNLFSRATGNGLETDELGLGGLLVESLLDDVLIFSGLKTFSSRIFFGFLI